MIKAVIGICCFTAPLSAFTNTNGVISALGVRRCNANQISLLSVATDKVENSIDLFDKPKWAAGGIVSDLVNALIAFKPLFKLLKIGARKVIMDSAEKKGVLWRMNAASLKEMSSNVLQDWYEDVEVKDTVYPEYYTQEFHAYDEGNLNWMAACECESATMAMALRVYPNDELTAIEAQDKLRASILGPITAYLGRQPNKVLDIGCSVGVSTFYLAKQYPEATVIDGIDLCPHFLAVAKHKQKLTLDVAQGDVRGLDGTGYALEDVRQLAESSVSRIRWIHGNAEATCLPDNEYDIVPATFVFHELPSLASSTIIEEMYRITAPGGVVAITDNDPRSAVIKNLPPAIFAMMKSTVRFFRLLLLFTAILSKLYILFFSAPSRCLSLRFE